MSGASMNELLARQEMDLEKAIEFIPGRLYYVALSHKPQKQKKAAYFSIDEELVYWNFYLDFGPLNMGQLFRFCQILQELLIDPKLKNKRLYYYSSKNDQKRANAAFLISSFIMIYLNKTPEEAYKPFESIYPPFPPFHDATPCVCTYRLTVLDCLRGLHRGIQNGFVDFKNFDIDEYEYFERVECGDLNWICKDKFLAFAGPSEYRMDTGEGYETFVPEDYIPYFKKKNVTLVIRLNKKTYDEKRFERAGIKHLDLYYPDGTNPPEHILRKFLEACENNEGAIAVHCKAGLGRTGTCIGAYMMKHHQWSHGETIGFLRVCRPGSVIGPQQQYLQHMEPILRQEGRNYRQMKTHVSKFFEYSYYSSATGSSGSINTTLATSNSSSKIDSMVGHFNSLGMDYEEKQGYSDDGLTQGDHLRSQKKTSSSIILGKHYQNFQQSQHIATNRFAGY